MSDIEFFEILGYLSAPDRRTKLDAELHDRSRQRFELKYARLSGIQPQQPDGRNYYILHSRADKWGVELRVYFVSVGQRPQAIENLIVTPRPSTIYNSRINRNLLIWRFIEYGFILFDTQNVARIRSRIPPQYLVDFNRGFRL